MAREIMRRAVAGTRYVVERKGDRVVGRLELADGAGPLGARHFAVDIRVPKSRDWTDERRAAAARIAACWCRCIGNLDRIDKPLIGHIIQRLKQYTEVELLCAVQVYSASAWHREHQAFKRPGKFFTENGVIRQWLAKSPEFARLLRTATMRYHPAPNRARDAAAGVAPAVPNRDREGAASVPNRDRKGAATLDLGPGILDSGARVREEATSPRTQSDDQLRAEYRRVLADRQAHAAADAVWSKRRYAIWAAAYDALPASEHPRILAETERSFPASLRRNDGTLRVDHDSAQFRHRLHERAWLAVVAGGKRPRERFAVPAHEPPPRTALFLADRVEAEVRRRACADFTYPTADGRRPRDPSAAVRTAETQLMEEWLATEPPTPVTEPAP